MKKIIATIACCSVSLLPIMSTAAFAFTIDTATIDDPLPAGIDPADAQEICTQKALAHGASWTGTLDESSIQGTVTTPPTPDGARDINEDSRVGVGDLIPTQVQVVGDPFRIGGSVNMFGYAQVVAAHYADSEYDFTQHFAWQSTYTFTCNMTEAVPTGHHQWNINLPGLPNQNACDAYDQNGLFQGEDNGPCLWVAGEPDIQARPDEYGSIGPVNEGGNLDGHETSGGEWTPEVLPPTDPVQVVVCISPKKLPGVWTAKNGYSGGSSVQGEPGCNTGWYNGGAKNQPDPYSNLNTGSNNIVTIPLL